MTEWVLAGLAIIAAVGFGGLWLRARADNSFLEQQQARRNREHAAELAQVTELRDVILKTVDDALLVLNPSQRILYANPSAETLIGRAAVSETLLGVLPNPELEALLDDAQKLRGEAVERRIEFNKRILLARVIGPLRDEQPFWVLTLRDVTQVQRLERARREMVANITHELGTPITAISLLTETLLNMNQAEKPKRQRKMLKDILRESNTLTHLVQEMRDLSLIESGQMPVRLTPVDLLHVVQLTVEPLQTLAESKMQQIEVTVPFDICVLADSQQIQRAIKNILHNAIKFTPERGKILISATVNEGEAILSVKDSGPGIPAEDLPRIFERFFQVDRARRDGTGLGLAIVRHIVQAHGGRAWAESTPGAGATFFIALALTDMPLSLDDEWDDAIPAAQTGIAPLPDEIGDVRDDLPDDEPATSKDEEAH
jgi:two-component system phosphate regulon sensor histidine kinase PhoR